MILLAAVVIAFRAIEEMIQGPGVHELEGRPGADPVAGGWSTARSGSTCCGPGRRRGSVTLVADGKHLLTDAITSAAVLVALLVMWFKPAWTWVDPIAALLVAAYIAYMALAPARASPPRG